MYLESIELKNFRNYESLHLELDPSTNIFFGDNAQGKTNLLEAVFLSCTSKSHRTSKDREMIRFMQEDSHVKVILRKKRVPYRIDVHLKKNRTRGIAIDGIPIRRASDLFGLANVVCFSPEDLSLIKDGPQGRRRFLDLELCQLDKVYLHHLLRYNRALGQRNQLLRDVYQNPSLLDTLPVWNEELVKHGLEIMRIRQKFLTRTEAIVSEIHSRITGGKEHLEISYEKNVEAEGFLEKLSTTQETEIRQKMTLSGPHRDDIGFRINGENTRKFGSQGQKRTAALSLKLSEIELVKELTGEEPILLLDDVLSELDRKRQNDLLQFLHGSQCIITCTGLDDFIEHHFPMKAMFYVNHGSVAMVNQDFMRKKTEEV